MTSRSLSIPALFLSILALSACAPSGGGGGGTAATTATPGQLPRAVVETTYAPECEVACRTESDNAGCVQAPTCVSDCQALTSGLETRCGKCVALATNVYQEEDTTGACVTEVGAIDSYACRDACSTGTHELRPNFRAECEVRCRQEADASGCAQPVSCVSDCVAMTAGLETQCGKCVVQQTLIYNEDGTCSLDLGSVESYGCGDECAPGTHQPRNDFAAECEVVCRREAESSGCASPWCVSDCVALTGGLETQCGKCVAAETNIYDEDGTCDTEPADVMAYGCQDVCSPGTHTARPDFRAECEVACRRESEYSGCPQPATCVQDCVVMTNGLETHCGKCVATELDIFNDDGTCDFELGTVESYGCRDVCD